MSQSILNQKLQTISLSLYNMEKVANPYTLAKEAMNKKSGTYKNNPECEVISS